MLSPTQLLTTPSFQLLRLKNIIPNFVHFHNPHTMQENVCLILPEKYAEPQKFSPILLTSTWSMSLLVYFNNFLNHLTISRLPPIAYSQLASQSNPSKRSSILIDIFSLLSSKSCKSTLFQNSQVI